MITWISIFFYDQILPFIFFLPPLICFFSFFSLPQVYLPPHGIILKTIESNYQLVILLWSCCSIWIAPCKLSLLSLGFTLGILQVIQTTDWFNLYVAFELLLILVFIAGVKTNWKARHEYFERQIIASCVILFGITRLYANNGNLIIGKFTDLFWSIGLFMKLGIWPFDRILHLYSSISDRYLYFFTVCILSKAFLYCLRFCDPTLARVFLLANLFKSSMKIISTIINSKEKQFSFSFASWNIAGLNKHINNAEFKSFLKSFDIIYKLKILMILQILCRFSNKINYLQNRFKKRESKCKMSSINVIKL